MSGANSAYPDALDALDHVTQLRNSPDLTDVLNKIQQTVGTTGAFNFVPTNSGTANDLTLSGVTTADTPGNTDPGNRVATKQYVDDASYDPAQDFVAVVADFSTAVPGAFTGVGLGTYDNYTVQPNDRVLVSGAQDFNPGGVGSHISPSNGLYEVGNTYPHVWSRPADFATGSVFNSRVVTVANGLYHGGQTYGSINSTDITVDTTEHNWSNTRSLSDLNTRTVAYVADYLKPFDPNDPTTDPIYAWIAALESLPTISWYRSGGPTLEKWAVGVIEWPAGTFICGWACALNSRFSTGLTANQVANLTSAFVGDPGPLVITRGQGRYSTRLLSCFPGSFLWTQGSGNESSQIDNYMQVGGGWRDLSIDGTFAPAGAVGYTVNCGETFQCRNLDISNFGPCPGPFLATQTVGGATLAAGGWGIITTVAGSTSTSNWTTANSQYVGWADGSYTGGPTESQESPEQQIITTAGQGISISLPAYFVPQPPWGFNIYARPVCQVDASTGGSNPACNSITSLTVNSATPLNMGTHLWSSSPGTFNVMGLSSSGVPGLAVFNYTGITGNTFTGVSFNGSLSVITGSGTISTGDIVTGPKFQQIAANVAPGTAPNGTPYVWSSGNYTSSNHPSSQNVWSTGAYFTKNGTSDTSGWLEKPLIEMSFYNCGTGVIIDAMDPPSGAGSFEYGVYRLHFQMPPGGNGLVAINGAWLNDCEFNIIVNGYSANDGAGFLNSSSQMVSVVGGNSIYTGCLTQLLLGGVIKNSIFEVGGEGNSSTLPKPGFVATPLAGGSGALNPQAMIVDAGNDAVFYNNSGRRYHLNAFAGPFRATFAVTGSLGWGTTFSYTGMTNDATMISNYNTQYSASVTAPGFVHI